ncbi:hypothetical protein OG216_01850 [Streptomycetaceae bacterium NBC_01309]
MRQDSSGQIPAGLDQPANSATSLAINSRPRHAQQPRVGGAWEGASQRAGEPNSTHHRFELTDGEVGDRIGKVWAVYPHALCVADIVLAGNAADHALPEGQGSWQFSSRF